MSYYKRKLKSRPVLRVDEGEYRTFVTRYVNGRRETLGIPKENCRDQRIWAGVDYKEIGRCTYNQLSYSERRLLEDGGCSFDDEEYPEGYCQRCGKQLRGNTRKPLCYACWKKSN